jgi:peptide/nickel transport system permease protein
MTGSAPARARTLGFYLRGNLLTAVGLSVLAVFLILALLAPWIAPFPGDAAGQVHPNHALLPPSGLHPFGTDNLGRDLFSLVLLGARISLGAGFVTILFALLIGVTLGLLAGYSGGWVDEVIMRFTDIVLGFPSLLLAVAIATTLGASLDHAVIAMALSWWPWYTRLLRSQVLALRRAEYVEAARLSGRSRGRILLRHILPNALTPVVVQASMDLGSVILTLAGLSFLGLGAQPPTPEWGLIISQGQNYVLTNWWYVTFPGLAILLSVSALNLVGDGLNDLLNPRERGVL